MRVKRGIVGNRSRKAVLKHTKGFGRARRVRKRVANEALMHAWTYAYRDRKKKKGEFRKLWNIKISAGAQQHGLSYSRLIGGLKKANVMLDKKSLADLAENHPTAFKAVIDQVAK